MTMENLLLPVLLLLTYLAFGDVECLMELHYVYKLQWDKSSCKSANIDSSDNPWCKTLLSLFGVGIAQYLRDASMFELPSNASFVSCLDLFQQQLESLSLSPHLVSICLKNIVFEFVSSSRLCAGLQTKQDWMRKLGISPLDSACKGDLLNRAACQACKDSGDLVERELVKMYINLTNVVTGKICYYFTVMYAAGVANEFGPKTERTTQCILGLPFVQTTSYGRVLTYGFMGAVASLLICALGFLYRPWERKRSRKVEPNGFVRWNEEILKSFVKPNTGVVWFGIQAIKAATDNFSEANLIGQGGFATVYRGTLLDGRRVAVKRIRNCTLEGDSEFLNEVEGINNIRDRNLVIFRGCCVASNEIEGHRNLVVFRGCCVASDEIEGHQRFLIYDYMPNGTLNDHIFGEKSKA